MVWYSKSLVIDRTLHIEYNGQDIEEVMETQLLGVILDDGHISNMYGIRYLEAMAFLEKTVAICQ